MNILKIQIAILSFFFGWTTPEQIVVCEESYRINVVHPGIENTESLEKILIKSSCSTSEPLLYYMDVESVVCGDSQCKIDIVRMYWDAFGVFKRIELPPGVDLEKAEGTSFSTEDYAKLNGILINKKSSLKDVQKYEVTGSETSEGVDALAGETIALNLNSYVKGAVWTCYTLWHWANGEVVTIIQNKTGNLMTVKELVAVLQEPSSMHKIFALEQLIRLKYVDREVQNAVLSLNTEENLKLQKLVVAYVSQISKKDYMVAVGYLLEKRNDQFALLVLKSILNSAHEMPKEFLRSVSEYVINSNSYQQLEVLLAILETRSITFPQINKALTSLLKHSNFLISRRVYWYLSEQELSEESELKLQSFKKENSKKL
ncbi:MAG: hypothetical protein ABJI22_05620 [Maribacter sp.]